LIIALCFNVGSVYALDATETAGWFVETYGVAESDLADRAQRIFGKVKRASKNAPTNTKLLVVKEGPKSLAVALPDGNIVVSLGTLVFAYHGVDCDSVDCSTTDCQLVDCELGDARLAFIFGHELAHQANRDFWIEGLKILGSKSKIVESRLIHSSPVRHELEIKADESGFINASLAGFRTDRLIGDGREKQSFIEYWVEQIGAVNPKTHPDPENRAAVLRDRLAALESKSEIFKYGVRLAHFGRYDDAIEFLQAFEREYPSREVLNNLGYVYLQLARQKMPKRLAYRFWYPTLLETDPGYPHQPIVRGSKIEEDELIEEALALLDIAKQYLLRAVELDTEDIVTRENLIAVYLYLGKTGTARDLIDEVADLIPDNAQDIQLEGLRALVLYSQTPDFTWKQATDILRPLSQLSGVDNNIIYNYGRLLQERGRTGAAKEQWIRLINQRLQIPKDYRRAICRETTIPDCDQEPEQDDIDQYNVFWNLPLKHGDDVNSPEVQQKLIDWRDTRNTQIGNVAARILTASNGDTMLALDDKIEFATLKAHSFTSAEDLLVKLGKPVIRYPLARAQIWSYGTYWSALVESNKVKEIWVSRP